MKGNKPDGLVSVVLTTYNRERLAREAIESILSQTYSNIELIVVDNYSSYDFPGFAKSFNDPRIIAIQNSNHGIIAVNRNMGLRHASGKYVAFCDDDDIWMPTKLEKQLHYFEDPEIVGVGSSAVYVGDLSLNRNSSPKADLCLDFHGLINHQTAALSSLVVRNKNFLFDESENLKTVEDFDFQLKVALESGGKIRLLPDPLIFYRIHAQNENKDMAIAENVFNVIDKYKNSLSDYELAMLYRKHYFNLGIKAIRQNNRMSASYFKDACRFSFGRQKQIALILFLVSCLPGMMAKYLMFFYYKSLKRISQQPFR